MPPMPGRRWCVFPVGLIWSVTGPNWSVWNLTSMVAHPTEALGGHGPPPHLCALLRIMLLFVHPFVHNLLHYVPPHPYFPAVMPAMPCFLLNLAHVVRHLSDHIIFERRTKRTPVVTMEKSSSPTSCSSGDTTPPVSPQPAPEELDWAASPEEAASTHDTPEDIVEIRVGDLELEELAPPPVDVMLPSSPPPCRRSLWRTLLQ